MKGLNKVTLIGNLGKDPEISTLEGDIALAKFTLATNESYKDQNGNTQTITDWHNIVAWRNMARVQHGILSFVGSLIVGLTLSSCAFTTTVEVKPSDCVNPTARDCSGATNESRILEVRLYQLKQFVDPCRLDIDAFAAGKDLDAFFAADVIRRRS